MLQKNTFLLLTSLSILTASLADAETVNSVSSYSWLPDHGRVLASGAAVSDVKTIAGDSMLPVFGNSEGFAYADFMGDYGSDDTYLVSPGLGYRKVINDQIAGAYFFADYEKVSLGPNFWVMSPGLEWMNSHWDAHVNGYFPTETREKTGSDDFLSNYGDYSEVSFVEGTHNQYDELVAPYAVIGNGVDAEIAYSFSGLSGLRTRAYLGGYYYTPPNDSINGIESYSDINNITGVTAGFEQPISKNLHLALFNSYDNVNDYAVGVSLTATFGQDSTVFSNNIHDRLLDPVQRHVGIIDTGAGTYDQQNLEDTGINALQYDNVYFIEPDSLRLSSESTEPYGNTSSDIGTYGNAATLNQATLDAINTQSEGSARIYIQGGPDANYYVDSTTTGNTTGLVVYDGQELYGRSENYAAPADADEQPMIIADETYSGFYVGDSGNYLFSDLTIMNIDGGGSGINIVNTEGNQTTSVINTEIYGFNYGISADNAGAGTLTLSSNNLNSHDNIFGILANNINNTDGVMLLNLNNSQFNNNTNSGIYIDNNGSTNASWVMNVTNSTFDNNLQAGLFANNDDLGTGTAELNIMSSSFNDNGNVGLEAANINTPGSIFLTVDDSSFDGNGASGMNLGNRGTGSLIADISNSSFDDNGSEGLIVSNTNQNGGTTIGVWDSTFDNNTQNGADISAYSGYLTFYAWDSSFNNNGNNGLNSGLFDDNGHLLIDVSNSEFNNNGRSGFYFGNMSTGTADIYLSGTFNDNASYGIEGYAASPGNSSITYIDSTLTGNTSGATNSDIATNITWTELNS